MPAEARRLQPRALSAGPADTYLIARSATQPSQPAFLGLIGQTPRPLLTLQTLVPDVPPVTGEQTKLSLQESPSGEACQGFSRIGKAMKRAFEKKNHLLKRKADARQMCSPLPPQLSNVVGIGPVIAKRGQILIKHSLPEAQ